MAILNTRHPTLTDWAKTRDPDGGTADVAELLSEMNEILLDMVWVEGNLPTGNQSVIRTGLPGSTFRRMYGGVQPSKSRTAKVVDTCGDLQAFSIIDSRLAEMAGDLAEYRLQESSTFLESMNQTMSSTIFYGNEATDSDKFTGLAPRFNDLSADNATHIIDAGGTGSDNASIWLVVWHPMTVAGIFPQGSRAGLERDDEGKITLEAAPDGGGSMKAYREHFQWHAGLMVRDWRFVVRIANIDRSLLTIDFNTGTKTFSAGANLPTLMFRAMRRIWNLGMGRPSFYMDRDIATFVAEQKAALGLESYATSENVAGDEGWTERFKGIPIRRVDALQVDEARVT